MTLEGSLRILVLELETVGLAERRQGEAEPKLAGSEYLRGHGEGKLNAAHAMRKVLEANGVRP